MVHVILQEPVTNLGELGDEVNVKPGYARNYLLPQGMAVRATPENRKVFEERRAELERAASDKLTAARGRAAGLEGVAVTVFAKVGDEGRLFGSVGTGEIAAALVSLGHDVRKAEVRMPEGVIRLTGEYDIDIQLHSEVTTAIKVIVAAE
ncbi:MAG: 50S ribosomal protein L9 [Pseudomonadales bacterium]